jgi:hypothetical protein
MYFNSTLAYTISSTSYDVLLKFGTQGVSDRGRLMLALDQDAWTAGIDPTQRLDG